MKLVRALVRSLADLVHDYGLSDSASIMGTCKLMLDKRSLDARADLPR